MFFSGTYGDSLAGTMVRKKDLQDRVTDMLFKVFPGRGPGGRAVHDQLDAPQNCLLIRTREQVAAALERFRPLGHIADRDARDMEYAALFLDRSAVT